MWLTFFNFNFNCSMKRTKRGRDWLILKKQQKIRNLYWLHYNKIENDHPSASDFLLLGNLGSNLAMGLVPSCYGLNPCILLGNLFSIDHSRPLFLYLRLFISYQYKSFFLKFSNHQMMTGFEQQISGVRSDHSTN